MTLTVTDLFAGGGGSSTGLTRAGYRVVIAANHDPIAVATHKANHPTTEHRTADLQETDFRTFPRTNLAWISPSCVWHCRSGGRKKPSVTDERRRADAGSIDRATAFAVIQATEVHQYDAVIVENVPEFQAWTLYEWWLDGMRTLGYRAQVAILNSADVGDEPVAQHRIRYYAVFTRDGNVDLTPRPVARVAASTILDPDIGRLLTRRGYVARQIDEIEEVGVPHLVTYRRNAHARPADRHPLATITGGGNHHAIATWTGDGIYHRLLTNRERARAQGFPDDYVFHGNQNEVRRQIANAVSVNVAQFLGEQVARSLGVVSTRPRYAIAESLGETA